MILLSHLSSRVQSISEFLCTVQTFETLGLSRIEGIETFNARFNLLVSNLKKKGYDPLDHRKQDFDVDYHDFKLQVTDVEVWLHSDDYPIIIYGIRFSYNLRE